MSKILVLGSGSRALITALTLSMTRLDKSVREAIPTAITFHAAADDFPVWTLKPAAEDPFRGGCRSKGEKKRAARERRQRGGY
ncbi:hypothetical protein D3879_14765 [Pseudomonas cavernicola]|uniref:Uncharacterized protein n=1 Tax=Pseudomonas cavernicola TaxID=2320866 RepID=A0A418XF23_9PSED|nr:hypothetical protein [Pseudomonas cavernicola]RJG10938.1 hypothetical protein D3879_14765 [Pseudomonas cavernicola]